MSEVMRVSEMMNIHEMIDTWTHTHTQCAYTHTHTCIVAYLHRHRHRHHTNRQRNRNTQMHTRMHMQIYIYIYIYTHILSPITFCAWRNTRATCHACKVSAVCEIVNGPNICDYDGKKCTIQADGCHAPRMVYHMQVCLLLYFSWI